MKILELIEEKARKQDLRFLVIGGHAVNIYGVQRTTADLDLLINRDELSPWKEIILGFCYKVFHEHTNFIQFSVPELGYWPLDLMLVDSEVFEKMIREAKNVTIGLARVNVPKLEHLIALKLHAMKENLPHREHRDMQDVLDLIEQGEVDVEAVGFRQLCLKYVTIEQYEAIQSAVTRRRKT